MTDYTCPGCGPAFSGAFNGDLRCIACGAFVRPLAPAPETGEDAASPTGQEACHE